MTIHPGVPANTVLEFVAYAKANRGKVNYASPGFGTSSHLFGELLKQRTGIEIVHVPYRGATPAIADLLAGQVQMFIDNLRNVQSFIQAGKLRALAVTSEKRHPEMPDLPTMAEAGSPSRKKMLRKLPWSGSSTRLKRIEARNPGISSESGPWISSYHFRMRSKALGGILPVMAW